MFYNFVCATLVLGIRTKYVLYQLNKLTNVLYSKIKDSDPNKQLDCMDFRNFFNL